MFFLSRCTTQEFRAIIIIRTVWPVIALHSSISIFALKKYGTCKEQLLFKIFQVSSNTLTFNYKSLIMYSVFSIHCISLSMSEKFPSFNTYNQRCNCTLCKNCLRCVTPIESNYRTNYTLVESKLLINRLPSSRYNLFSFD